MNSRILLALFLCMIPMTSIAREAKQDARIEHLIGTVKALKGAAFIRNGTEYDTDAAASHLRMKLGKAGERVKTAEDFIDGLASKSSVSGKPYQIRKADGTVTDARPFFGKEPRFRNRDCNRHGIGGRFAAQVAISESRFLSGFAVPEGLFILFL